jgi:hypothetical protein
MPPTLSRAHTHTNTRPSEEIILETLKRETACNVDDDDDDDDDDYDDEFLE